MYLLIEFLFNSNYPSLGPQQEDSQNKYNKKMKLKNGFGSPSVSPSPPPFLNSPNSQLSKQRPADNSNNSSSQLHRQSANNSPKTVQNARIFAPPPPVPMPPMFAQQNMQPPAFQHLANGNLHHKSPSNSPFEYNQNQNHTHNNNTNNNQNQNHTHNNNNQNQSQNNNYNSSGHNNESHLSKEGFSPIIPSRSVSVPTGSSSMATTPPKQFTDGLGNQHRGNFPSNSGHGNQVHQHVNGSHSPTEDTARMRSSTSFNGTPNMKQFGEKTAHKVSF